jgi:hypothetical protein
MISLARELAILRMKNLLVATGWEEHPTLAHQWRAIDAG